MTKRDVSRADILSEVCQRKRTQEEAAKLIGVTTRHFRRLYKAYIERGVSSLVSFKRGKPSNHQLLPLVKARISELVTCELYSGFKPTLMCEKLEQLHKITVSKETVRQLMIKNGVWRDKSKKCPVVHQQRKRRAQFGELIQIDGSPHAWFEDRGDSCVLINFIDDATGRAYGQFFPSETTHAYMTVLKEYIIKYGRMSAVYSDKHGIFRVNSPGCTKKECITQLGRALRELGINSICAHSPQAKGRVERLNQTCQDRLVKELRLAGICNMAEANIFLKTRYWDDHNKRFAILPENSTDAHRKILSEQNLDGILCHKERRKVMKNLEFQYKNIIYQIPSELSTRGLRGAYISVLEGIQGDITIEYRGKAVPFARYSQQEFTGEIVDSKEVDNFMKPKKERKPDADHPWRHYQNLRQQDWGLLPPNPRHGK